MLQSEVIGRLELKNSDKTHSIRDKYSDKINHLLHNKRRMAPISYYLYVINVLIYSTNKTEINKSRGNIY